MVGPVTNTHQITVPPQTVTRKRIQQDPLKNQPPLKQPRVLRESLTFQQKASLLPILSDTQLQHTLKELQPRHFENQFFTLELTLQRKIFKFLPKEKLQEWLPYLASKLIFPRDQELLNSLPRSLLILVIPFLTLEQFRAACSGIGERILRIVKRDLTFAEVERLITRRRVQEKAPYLLAMGMKVPYLYENLIHHSEKMTVEQLRAVITVLDIHSLAQLFHNASLVTKHLIPQLLIKEQRMELRQYAEAEIPNIQKVSENAYRTSEEILAALKQLDENINQSDCEDLSIALNDLKKSILSQKQNLQKRFLELNLLSFLFPDITSIDQISTDLQLLSSTYHSYLKTYFLTQDCLAQKIEIKRRQFFSAEEEPIIGISQPFDLKKFKELYSSAQTALEQIDIVSGDLDRVGLSWEDIIEAGIRTKHDLIRNGLTTAEEILEFIQSGKKVPSPTIWRKILNWVEDNKPFGLFPPSLYRN